MCEGFIIQVIDMGLNGNDLKMIDGVLGFVESLNTNVVRLDKAAIGEVRQKIAEELGSIEFVVTKK